MGKSEQKHSELFPVFQTSSVFPLCLMESWIVTHRVLVTDKLAEEGLARLRSEPGIEVVVDTKLAQDPASLRQKLREADGIVIRSGTQLTAEVLEGQSRLKAIVRAGVGVDNIDV